MDARTALLTEMVREGERVLDHQILAMEELDDKSEQMIRLGVASLAGGLALALLIVRGGREATWPVIGALGAATAMNVAALVLFVDSYIGLRWQHEIHVGPSLQWVRDRAEEGDWTLERHLALVVASFPRFHDYNVARMADSTVARRSGVHLLLGTVTSYALALVLMMVEGP